MEGFGKSQGWGVLHGSHSEAATLAKVEPLLVHETEKKYTNYLMEAWGEHSISFTWASWIKTRHNQKWRGDGGKKGTGR